MVEVSECQSFFHRWLYAWEPGVGLVFFHSAVSMRLQARSDVASLYIPMQCRLGALRGVGFL
jgi:hypothetical protein